MLSLIAVSRDMRTDICCCVRFYVLSKLHNSQTGYWRPTISPPSRFPSPRIKPRWRPIVKHRQNVGKPSFRKLTMEMPVEVTSRTALSNFLRLHCKFFGQFRRLVRTKIWPSSIIIRYVGNYVYTGYFTVIVCHATHNFQWK